MSKKVKGAAGMAITRRQNISLHYQVVQLEEQLDNANYRILFLEEENKKLKRELDYIRKENNGKL